MRFRLQWKSLVTSHSHWHKEKETTHNHVSRHTLSTSSFSRSHCLHNTLKEIWCITASKQELLAQTRFLLVLRKCLWAECEQFTHLCSETETRKPQHIDHNLVRRSDLLTEGRIQTGCKAAVWGYTEVTQVLLTKHISSHITANWACDK